MDLQNLSKFSCSNFTADFKTIIQSTSESISSWCMLMTADTPRRSYAPKIPAQDGIYYAYGYIFRYTQ
jgi:hypothetical protein